ncbi:PD-(D/E)XK nuclease domain-containing protein [Glycomyces albidus]|uniref:Uncharacterized protein n=1 Tax=Glycomyces albidus TaxID=2656774 RepID=A0A6L5G4T5_9ACTN|nr:hypothetical protein [Glycomyces albidus]MQM24635.1 hypothetical protein [Glycomyces albidus]
MTTRNTASRIRTLLQEAPALEDLGALVQGEDEPAGLAASELLAKEYRAWFSSSLGVLPEDLRDRFRFEYEGGGLKFRIKHFLQQPRTRSAFYNEDLDDNSKQIFSPWQHPFSDRFTGPLRQQQQYLEEALARLGTEAEAVDTLDFLEHVSRLLPMSFSILAQGHRDRSGLKIENEYDVQHVLHAILVLHFEEVEPEEPTPKMAGASSRLDFLLKQERVAIETKMMRTSLSLRALRDELAVDIQYFRRHPDVDSLFILVYDPAHRIINARGFERDLSTGSDGFTVRAVITS